MFDGWRVYGDGKKTNIVLKFVNVEAISTSCNIKSAMHSMPLHSTPSIDNSSEMPVRQRHRSKAMKQRDINRAVQHKLSMEAQVGLSVEDSGVHTMDINQCVDNDGLSCEINSNGLMSTTDNVIGAIPSNLDNSANDLHLVSGNSFGKKC